jgi:hypothetical protein
MARRSWIKVITKEPRAEMQQIHGSNPVSGLVPQMMHPPAETMSSIRAIRTVGDMLIWFARVASFLGPNYWLTSK